MRLGNRKNLPITVHARDSLHILIELLKKESNDRMGCSIVFTGSLEEAKELLKLDYYLGIGGVVTYKNTHLREIR